MPSRVAAEKMEKVEKVEQLTKLHPEKLRAACSIHRDDALSSHQPPPLLRRAPGPHRAGRGVLLLLNLVDQYGNPI